MRIVFPLVFSLLLCHCTSEEDHQPDPNQADFQASFIRITQDKTFFACADIILDSRCENPDTFEEVRIFPKTFTGTSYVTEIEEVSGEQVVSVQADENILIAPAARLISLDIEPLGLGTAYFMGFKLQYRAVDTEEWQPVGNRYFTGVKIGEGTIVGDGEAYYIENYPAEQLVEYQFIGAPLANEGWFSDIRGYDFKFNVE